MRTRVLRSERSDAPWQARESPHRAHTALLRSPVLGLAAGAHERRGGRHPRSTGGERTGRLVQRGVVSVPCSMHRRLSGPRATAVLVGLAVSISMAQQLASAFSLSAVGRGAVRRLGAGAGACGLRAAPPAWQAAQAARRSGLRPLSMAGDKDGLGDKNITVGPDGIKFDDVGAVGNLRFPGKGFKAPEQKPNPDVGVNFKVKKKAKGGIDQDSAKQAKGSEYNLDNLVEFPCLFQLKVLGYRQGEFVEDILDLIGATLGTLPPRLSREGPVPRMMRGSGGA